MKTSRRVATVAVGAIAAICLTACGGVGGAVAQVGGVSISKAAVEHWARVEAVLSYEVIPRKPVPKGVVPDPPEYTACIAFLRAGSLPIASGGTNPTPAQLKRRCEQEQAELKRKGQGYLIAFQWLSGELADRHINISEAEVQKAYDYFKRKEFTGNQFRDYLAYTGMSLADVRFIIKDTVLSTRLQKYVISKAGMTPEQQRQALASFTRKWTAKTSCRTGYLVAGCKQYKGSETPP